MPISAAALAGIQANGHRWKYEIAISAHTSKIGSFDETTPADQISAERDAIVAKVKRWLDARTKPEENDMRNDIESKIIDLEMVDESVEEVRYALNDLFDEFDFYRVVVV